MKTTDAISAMNASFIDALRLVHCSRPSSGVFVLSSDSSRFHSLIWGEYPVTSMHGPFIPRLHIDRFSDNLPASVAATWRIEPDALFVPVGIEITVLENQIPALSTVLPAVISHIEQGQQSGFDALLPFATCCTTPTNIWSIEADAHANTSKT